VIDTLMKATVNKWSAM